MIARLRAFAMFWYNFVVGDDWRMAAGVVGAFAATFAISRTSLPAWWVAPAAVVLLLGLSLWLAARR